MQEDVLQRIVVVIPTYNEADNLSRLLPPLLSMGASVLVADDSSPDGTADVVREHQKRHGGRLRLLLRPQRLGMGSAYRDSYIHLLSSETPEFIAQMDADSSHPPESLTDMLKSIQSDYYDIVLCSRLVRGGSYEGLPPLRRLITRCASLLCRIVIGNFVKDYTSGFRLWRASALRRIPLQLISSKSFAFQIEMLWWARRLGFRVLEVPMRFDRRSKGKSKMNLFTIIEALRLLLKISLSDCFR
ncbi:MAG: glycosyltransferase [Planctomycetota bacterium]|nr:glycosyltransferase [Planctomycetota bacterium]